MDIEEYAKRIGDTVAGIILDNRDKKQLTIDSIDISNEDCLITFTAVGTAIVKRCNDEGE